MPLALESLPPGQRWATRGCLTPSQVALSIYELHGSSALNLLTRAANMGGAYHVGVEVYFLEWSFGWCEEGSGVYMAPRPRPQSEERPEVFPGKSTLGSFRERVPLGRTPLTPEEARVRLVCV